MFADLMNLENCDSVRRLIESSPHKPFNWALGPSQQRPLVDYVIHDVQAALDAGGFARAYSLGGSIVGLCVTRPDDWASRELDIRAFRVAYLVASGKPEMQTMVKALLVRESVRNIPGRACFVVQVPHTDLSGINALERTGFVATQTSVILAKDLLHYGSETGAEATYQVHHARADDVDAIYHETASEIPEGILGWDYQLSDRTKSRVHRDWLAGYASAQGLLLAQDHGRPVGVLAERVNAEAAPYLGFGVGSVDFVATVPEYRNNGVARQLLADSLDYFKDRGVRLAEVTACGTDVPFMRYCQAQGFAAVENMLTLVNWRS